jgi:hypothetical protein
MDNDGKYLRVVGGRKNITLAGKKCGEKTAVFRQIPIKFCKAAHANNPVHLNND